MLTFDITSLGFRIFGQDNWLTKLNDRLHGSKIYNVFQVMMGGLASLSGGAYTGIKNTPLVCFAAGTMVATVSGYTAIEQITAGDFVTATDETTGKTGYKKVVETYVNHTKELIHIRIGEEVIKTTPGHLIYVSGKGFTRADELKPDDKVINDKNKECLIVSIQREEFDEEIPIYNMQVEDYHTYHVGKSGILVHNDCETRVVVIQYPIHYCKEIPIQEFI